MLFQVTACAYALEAGKGAKLLQVESIKISTLVDQSITIMALVKDKVGKVRIEVNHHRFSGVCDKLGTGVTPSGLAHRCQPSDKPGLGIQGDCVHCMPPVAVVHTAGHNEVISNLNSTSMPQYDITIYRNMK